MDDECVHLSGHCTCGNTGPSTCPLHRRPRYSDVVGVKEARRFVEEMRAAAMRAAKRRRQSRR